MSNDNTEASPPNQALSEKTLSDDISRKITTYLTRRELTLVSRINRFFKDTTAVSKLLDLVTRYEIDTDDFAFLKQKLQEDNIHYHVFYKDNETDEKIKITNPILIAIDIELQKDPLVAFAANKSMDPSKRHLEYSALEYAIRTENFIVINMIRNHAKRIQQENRVDEMVADIKRCDEKPIEPALLSILSDINMADRLLIVPPADQLPQIIPNNAIALQLKNDTLTTYRMMSGTEVDEETKEIKTVTTIKEEHAISLSEALKNKEEAYQNELKKFLHEKSYKEFILFGEDPHLVNTLRMLCGYDKLPFTNKKPTLIKQGDQITFWGKLSGQWRLHTLTSEQQDVFREIDFLNMTNQRCILTEERQAILKQYHTEYINLAAYKKNARAFLDKYPQRPSRQEEAEFNADFAEWVGWWQKLLSAWIAQLWSCNISLNHLAPDFKKFLLNANANQAHGTDITGWKYYNVLLGVSEGIVKDSTCFMVTSAFNNPQPCVYSRKNLAAMTVFSEITKRELEKVEAGSREGSRLIR